MRGRLLSCIIGGTVAVVFLGAWALGVRVVVIQPIGALPKGVTLLVTGVPGLDLIDSPDAICQRRQGGVSLLCRGITAGAIAEKAHVIARLPYSSLLFRVNGASDLER